MTYNFNLIKYIENYTDNCKKKISQIVFYFVEEGPGHGSEGIKKECNVTCFDFFLFSVFLMDVVGGKKVCGCAILVDSHGTGVFQWLQRQVMVL